MTHLEIENLASDYLEGRLEPALRLRAEEHLAGCSACRELVAGVRRVLELCRAAEETEPSPWLISRILVATTGQAKPGFKDRLSAFFRPAVPQRVAYALAMAVFSFSIIINAAGINLSALTLSSLNPRVWFYQANRRSHLLMARAEKFYYDLRVVYEIQSRLRQLREQSGTPQPENPKPEAVPGGTTKDRPVANPQLASGGDLPSISLGALRTFLAAPGAGRSTSR